MNRHYFSVKTKRKLIYAIRNYPFQIVGAGLVAALFIVILFAGLILPFGARGQGLPNAPKAKLALPVSVDLSGTLRPRTSCADLVEKVAPAVVTANSLLCPFSKPFPCSMTPSP